MGKRKVATARVDDHKYLSKMRNHPMYIDEYLQKYPKDVKYIPVYSASGIESSHVDTISHFREHLGNAASDTIDFFK